MHLNLNGYFQTLPTIIQTKTALSNFMKQIEAYESSSGAETEIAGFVAKTYQILNTEEYHKVVFWAPSGREFVIKDISKFEEVVLPRFFRHKKINSFIRQLNMYGFHKSRKETSKSVFSHPEFIRNRDDLLPCIKRKIKHQKSLKTPSKDKLASQDRRVPETAVKESDDKQQLANQRNEGGIPGFLESKEFLNSRFNLNISLKRVLSVNDFSQMNRDGLDDQVSIQLDIEEDQRGRGIQILNPSYFFEPYQGLS